MQERPTYSSEECLVLHESYERRLDALEKAYIDHAQRFDTLQTPFWKRLWFWIDGWPWHDLNGTQHHRPWHGRR
jgi:hypothetical protein